MNPITTNCPKCQSTHFEANNERISGMNFGVIRCSNCKAFLGVKDVADNLKAFQQISNDIDKIKKHLKID